MNADFLKFFKNFDLISLEDIKAIYGLAKIKRYNPGDIIVKEGQVYPYGIFVVKGLLRNYMISSSGNERTLKFTDKKEMTSVPSFITNAESNHIVEALEPSTVIIIDSHQLYKVSQSRPKLLRWRIQLMEKVILEMEKRVQVFTVYTAEERYLDLMENNASIIGRVEDRHLASFIGVTPVSFSRIKNRKLKV